LIDVLNKLHSKRKLKKKIKHQLKLLLPNRSHWEDIENIIRTSKNLKTV